jgi:AraC family transcriptional regulator of adaptative response/methylated-DNA-[protein]-cysteine methyltransferase
VPPLPSVPIMARALGTRDPQYDGVFLYGVRTTGIYCRPSCAARKPLPEHVEYFVVSGDAEQAGYRPCKRCRPDAADARPPWLIDLEAEVLATPNRRITDDVLTRRGLDPGTVRRWFKRHYGTTFQSFARSARLGHALECLHAGDGIDGAAFSAGFESVSGFRDAFERMFGAPPGRAEVQDHVAVHWMPSPLGPLVLGATTRGVCLVEFSDRERLTLQLDAVRAVFKLPIIPARPRVLDVLESELTRYFAGTLSTFTVPLVCLGTPFQEKVWRALLDIPYGTTRSYEDLALAVGSPKGQRAVGLANGRNRIAIVIPCHRVVNKGGKLGGYGGGLHRKEYLLSLESRISHL